MKTFWCLTENEDVKQKITIKSERDHIETISQETNLTMQYDEN